MKFPQSRVVFITLGLDWQTIWKLRRSLGSQTQLYNISMLPEYRNQCGEMKSCLLFSSTPVILNHEILLVMSVFSSHNLLSDASLLPLCYLHQHCYLHQLCCLRHLLAWFAWTVRKCWFVAKSTSHATERNSSLALVDVFGVQNIPGIWFYCDLSTVRMLLALLITGKPPTILSVAYLHNSNFNLN